jgi:hypothetical protein
MSDVVVKRRPEIGDLIFVYDRGFSWWRCGYNEIINITSASTYDSPKYHLRNPVFQNDDYLVEELLFEFCWWGDKQ